VRSTPSCSRHLSAKCHKCSTGCSLIDSTAAAKPSDREGAAETEEEAAANEEGEDIAATAAEPALPAAEFGTWLSGWAELRPAAVATAAAACCCDCTVHSSRQRPRPPRASSSLPLSVRLSPALEWLGWRTAVSCSALVGRRGKNKSRPANPGCSEQRKLAKTGTERRPELGRLIFVIRVTRVIVWLRLHYLAWQPRPVTAVFAAAFAAQGCCQSRLVVLWCLHGHAGTVDRAAH
jgi:hypothetical protein